MHVQTCDNTPEVECTVLDDDDDMEGGPHSLSTYTKETRKKHLMTLFFHDLS